MMVSHFLGLEPPKKKVTNVIPNFFPTPPSRSNLGLDTCKIKFIKQLGVRNLVFGRCLIAFIKRVSVQNLAIDTCHIA